MAGWLGSSNLGDEFVHAGVRRLLVAAGADRITAVSAAPAATRRVHGGAVVAHTDVRGIWRAIGRADLVVVGGGGIVQDLTSAFNLPYHLVRPWLATRRHTPWVGLALGIGPLVTRLGRRMTRLLHTAVAVSVRDELSRRTLADAGVDVDDVVVTADAAFALPPVDAPADDVVTAALRPWASGRRTLPVGARRPATPAWFVAHAAAALDAVAEQTGLPIELVALQPDRDHEVHLAVAASMRAPVTCVRPSLDDLVPAIGRGRIVVAMRYHAGVAAILAGRPLVTIGYTPKVAGLTAELDRGAALLAWEPAALDQVPAKVTEVAGHAEGVLAAREHLVWRAWDNLEVVQAGLTAAR